MTILIRQRSEPHVEIAPFGFEESDYEGRCWAPADSCDLVEAWQEIPGRAAATPALYRLVKPAMELYDDPFCYSCMLEHYRCECSGNRPMKRVTATMDGMTLFDYLWDCGCHLAVIESISGPINDTSGIYPQTYNNCRRIWCSLRF